MANDLWKKVLKTKSIAEDIIKEEDISDLGFLSTGMITTNLLFSGKVDGGIPIGKLSMIAAPPALGKSLIGYAALKDAQKQEKFCVLIDAEIAFSYDLARKMGIDVSKEKLLVIQNNQIEKIQEQIVNICDGVEKEERKNLFFLVDSVAAMLTSKTLNDAVAGKDVSDMTEAKKKNKLAKICMGLGATFFFINHVYDNIGGFGDPMSIPGGRGLQFMAHCIVMGQSKAKDKDSEGISGALITAKTIKSRFGKEHSKLQFRIKHDGGLDTFYGLLDDAVEGGFVKNEGGYIISTVGEPKKLRESQIYNSAFWLPIFSQTKFKDYLEDKYSFKNTEMDIAKNDICDMLNGEVEEEEG